MKKGIRTMLACVGIGVALVAGSLALNKQDTNVKTVFAASFPPTINVEFNNMRMPFKTFFDFPQGSEAEREIAKEIHLKYDNQQEELARTLKADIKEARANILGERYAEIKAEMKTLKEQYKELGIEFYKSPEYNSLIELKREQRNLIEQNKTQLDEQIDALTQKFLEESSALQENMRMELHLLQKTMCC